MSGGTILIDPLACSAAEMAEAARQRSGNVWETESLTPHSGGRMGWGWVIPGRCEAEAPHCLLYGLMVHSELS